MASIHSIARSTAVAGAALILVVGAAFAHDAVIGGRPATDPPSTLKDHDIPNADFEQEAESDEDAADRPEIDDQFEANDESDQPEAAEPAEAERPAKIEKHVTVVKPAKHATEAADEDDNDQGEDEDNDNNDQGENDDSDHHGSGGGEHDDGGDD